MFCSRKCPLYLQNKTSVPDIELEQAEICIVGEAPGVQEEAEGIPFVGRSGEEINKILRKKGVDRSTIFLGNVVKCRPSDAQGKNRPPVAKEFNSCSHYLDYNLLKLKPKLILALGRTACHHLIGKTDLKNLRGEFHLWNNIPVLASYHPSAGLHGNATMMRFFRTDLEKAIDFVNRPKPVLDYRLARKDNYLTYIEYLKKAKNLVVDLETTGTNWRKDKIITVAFCAKPGQAIVFDLREIPLEELRVLLEGPIPKIGQNIKFDASFIRGNGIDFGPILWDTMIAAHILDENRPSDDLNSLAADFTEIGGYECNLEEYKKEHPEIEYDYSKIPIEVLAKYTSGDVDATRRVYEYQVVEINKQKKEKIMSYIEIPMLSVLLDMEMRGMLIDTKLLDDLNAQYTTIIEETKKNITRFKRVKDFEAETGKVFNPASTDHIGKVLFKDQDLKPNQLSRKTNKPIVDKKALIKLQGQKFVQELLRLKDYSKQRSTYLIGIKDKTEDSILYPHFSQAVAKTLRLSSSAPNVQNIPERGQHKLIKKAFLARPGYMLISADYSQIELRILATISKDINLIEAFEKGADPIAEIGAALFKMPKEKITDDLRIKTKTFIYATIYGSTDWGLANRLDMPRKDIAILQRNFFSKFPRIRQYLVSIENDMQIKGVVTSPFGATRHLPDATEANYREAINFPIQNMAGFVLFLCMISLNYWMKKSKLDSYLVNTIHDQVLIEANTALFPGIVKDIKGICEYAPKHIEKIFNYRFATSLPVKVTTGISWGELEK